MKMASLLRTAQRLPSNLIKIQSLSRGFACTSVIRSTETTTQDTETHTGQKWETDDYRLSRFEYVPKQVVQKRAIDLIAEIPPIASDKRIVSCDGGGGPLGHPKVYINLDQPGNHSCTYCGLRFYKVDHHL